MDHYINQTYLPMAETIGDLKKQIKDLPDDMEFGFLNQPRQQIAIRNYADGFKRAVFNGTEDDSIPVELPVMQKIAGIRWEQRYSTTLEDDKMGRWMRIGRINGMTVAIILKAKERFIVKLPNNKGDESLENAIIVMSEQEAMLEAEKYIAKYVSNFSA